MYRRSGVRGLARYREAGSQPESARIGDSIGTGDLIGTGNLTVTLETDDGAQRYQGIVPLAGQRLAESLQVYFENSEQLPTRLWLHADSLGTSGMLLQKLPSAGSPAGTAVDAGTGVLSGAFRPAGGSSVVSDSTMNRVFFPYARAFHVR
jgi:redox-regulated HSP33 family molecular chaperone